MIYILFYLGLIDQCQYQVFGGSEGNSQADIFKDTKHLIMSVIDGYNVCIFAYGQTGAGKDKAFKVFLHYVRLYQVNPTP